MTSYAPTPISEYDLGFARARAANLQNNQTYYDAANQMQADNMLPSLMMGLSSAQTSQNPSQAPAPQPGQASTPSTGSAPSISRMAPQAAPQQASPQQPSGQPTAQQMGGYDLNTVIGMVKNQYPNISGGALRAVLNSMNPYLLTPKARLEIQQMNIMAQRLGIEQQNADTNAQRAAAYGANTNMRYASQFDPTGAPPAPPPGYGGGNSGPTQVPTSGIPQMNASALTAPVGNTQSSPPPSPMTPNSPTAGSFAQGQGDISFSKKAAELAAANANKYQSQLPVLANQAENLAQLSQLMTNPDFQTGAGGDLRVKAANIAYMLTGDPEFQRMAQTGQVDTKVMADLISNRISSIATQSGGASAARTAFFQNYMAQTKPSLSNQPAANASVIQAAMAQLQLQVMYQRFYVDKVNSNKGHIFYPEDEKKFTQIANKYPVFGMDKGGFATFQPDNLSKMASALGYKPDEIVNVSAYKLEEAAPAAATNNRNIAHDANGNIYVQDKNGQWVDQKTGKPYGGQ
ncbi:MAG: hypothetical protein KGL39_11680 [Patescibacteria group bacterium]|nr:hypothetical protein [Patescibacteria group bacterium]